MGAETGSLSVDLFKGGARSGEVTLPESIFGETPHHAVMHQALLRQLANARQGTASTKTRGLVSGGGAKPHRQKGTGRARHGSIREPSMVGGGTVFGPKPRSYAQRMPKKMRRLALRSALSVKAQEGLVRVVESFALEQPRTRLMAELLRSLGVEDTVLVVLPAPNLDVSRAMANLPWAKAVLAHNLGLYDIFTHRHVVVSRDALELLEENFGDPARPAPAAAPKAAPKAAAPKAAPKAAVPKAAAPKAAPKAPGKAAARRRDQGDARA